MDFPTAGVDLELHDSVPTFYLYGEPHQTVADDFLHVESLDLRSRPAGWRIRPHAHRELNHLILIRGGGGMMEVEANVSTFEAPCLLLVPARIVHGFRWQEESNGSVITLANSYRDELIRRDGDVAALFAVPAVAALASDIANAIDRQAKILIRELGWAAPGHRAAVDAALTSILVQALRSLAVHSATTTEWPGRHAAIVARYRAIVEERFRLREPIGAYAQRLGVSATTLRTACARIAGASPGEILDMRILLEAKRALAYSNLAIAEIAYGLGFTDAAYFTRMFTRSVGRSPRQFRQDRQNAALGPKVAPSTSFEPGSAGFD